MNRTYCITLKRTPERWQQFLKRVKYLDVFPGPIKYTAIDGSICKPPPWWNQGGGAWGCLESHRNIIAECLQHNVESVLILEDDAVFPNNFSARWQKCISTIPNDWEWAYFGGQHLEQKLAKPIAVNENWVQPYNINRTHAYALRGRRIMQKLYTYLHDYSNWEAKYHIDHHYGKLHELRQDKIYAANPFIIGQAEGKSTIAGRDAAQRYWISNAEHKPKPFILILGLHRSGSSCLAGVVNKLGIFLGNNLIGYERTGGFEAQGIYPICTKYAPFPKVWDGTNKHLVKQDLQQWIKDRYNEGHDIVGCKHPMLCYWGDIFQSIVGKNLHIIVADRPLRESIESINNRENGRGKRRYKDTLLEAHQHSLYNAREKFLETFDGPLLRLDYNDVCYKTRDVINTLCDFLPYTSTNREIENAYYHVATGERTIRLNALGQRIPPKMTSTVEG